LFLIADATPATFETPVGEPKQTPKPNDEKSDKAIEETAEDEPTHNPEKPESKHCCTNCSFMQV
jgi:hypothetical protein